MEIWATQSVKVTINPISVIENLNIIGKKDWINKEDNKYYLWTEEHGGHRSFDVKVKEVSKELFEAYEAQQLLLKYLNKQEK